MPNDKTPPLPDYLYSLTRSSEAQYANEPPGVFDASRFLRNLPPWKKPQTVFSRKPKTLILTDWRRWTKKKYSEYIKLFNKLKDEGFDLYLWIQYKNQPAFLLLHDEKKIKTLRLRVAIQPYEQLLNLAKHQLNLRPDQIVILDNQLLETLSNGKATPDNFVSEKLILAVTSNSVNTTFEETIRIIQNNTPNLRGISIHDFPNLLPLKELELTRQYLPELRIAYDDAFLNSEDFKTVVAGGETKKGFLSFKSDHLSNLSKLTLVNFQSDDIDLSYFKENRLRELTFNIAKLTTQSLLIFLQNVPTIKTLNLRNTAVLPCELTQFIYASALESLLINNTTFPPDFLSMLLRNTPTLKHLTLGASRQFTLSFISNDAALPELQILNLENYEISLQSLGSLIKNSKHLSILKLIDCKFLDESFSENFALESLDEVSLIGTPTKSVILKQLLKNTKHLRKLDLSGQDQLEEFDNDLNLDALENLELRGKTIPISNLEALLIKTHNLRLLDLSYAKIIGDSISTELTLEKLEIVQLINVEMSIETLIKLLKNSKKLKTLSLGKLTGNSPINLDLNELETLSFSNGPISIIQLNQILLRARNIQHIELPVGFSLENLDELPQLSFLKSIKFSPHSTSGKSNIILTIQNINLILQKFPSVETINGPTLQSLLREKKPSTFLFELEENSPSYPSLDATSDSTSRPQKRDAGLNFEAPTQNPTHQPDENLSEQPDYENSVFKYEGKNTSKNQGMIIEKLCQYLTVGQTKVTYIHKVRMGLCNALSIHFLERNFNDWHNWLEQIQSWNGERNTLNPNLRSIFNELLLLVERHQFQQNTQQLYLGSALSQFLQENPGEYQLFDAAWHSIAIRYDTDKKSWQFYDPNFIEGGEENISLENLLKKIQQSIGEHIQISVKEIQRTTMTSLPISIASPDKFLEVGGLFILAFSLNAIALFPLLAHRYSASALLQGLRLRDLNNTPAWVIGLLKHDTRSFTLTLLSQFFDVNPDAINFLDATLNKTSKNELLKLVSILEPINSNICMALLSKIKQRLDIFEMASYEKLFSNWNTDTSPQEALSYFQALVNSSDNTLVEFSDAYSLDAFSYSLQKYVISTSRPVFYVNSPDDLICSAPIININGNDGKIENGPGGALYDFLKINNENQAIIVINYQHFLPEDIIRFNTLLDPKPFVDGIPLPPNTQIIALCNTNHPNYYDGADFYSRFKTISSCKVTTDSLPLLPEATQDCTSTEHIEIDLYESDNWKDILLGQWGINGDALNFYPGALQHTLKRLNDTSSPIIVLNNPPKNNPEFVHFYQQVILHHAIYHAGHTITLPPGLQFQQNHPDHWPELSSNLTFLESIPENAFILSQSSFPDLFIYYRLEDKKLFTEVGLLEQNKEKRLSIELASSLTKPQWYQLLSEAKIHQIHISVYCHPGVALPEELRTKVATQEPRPFALLTQFSVDSTQLIQSADPDLSIASFIKASSDWLIIDVSECTFSDLYKSLRGKLENLHFIFSESQNVLLSSLKENKNVILTGHFSEELCDALAPFLLSRRREKSPSGNLIIIGKDMSGFSYTQVHLHEVSSLLRQEQLEAHFDAAKVKEISTLYPNESYTQLKTRLSDTSRVNPWIGLRDLPTQIKLPHLDFNTSKDVAISFMMKRQEQVELVLGCAPYVFLTGLTGVGKSTFVSITYPNAFIGEDKIINWAEDNSPGRKILFIDEANLSHSQWSEFQGLFQRQPGILIHGHYYPLTPEHKVIFAGNPVNYGDERKLSPLFEQHGHALLFEPMPEAFLYENILKPVFENKGFSLIEIQTVSKKILTLYRFFCQNAKDEVAISPRELQMIALLIISAKTLHQEESVEILADHYIQLIGQQLANTDLLSYFATSFQGAIFTRSAPEKISNFILTDSRLPLYHQLIDLLALQKFRQNTKNNSAQRYGGLGGIIIEGDPGIGKSEFVLNFLVSQGFHEIHSDHSSVSNGFYRMPVSWGIDEKTKLLLKAFDEGSIVLIDEINSSPMMERLLNCLLMGTTPDGKRASNPGFMIIGTQNPPTMAGRRKPSTALSRRLMHCTLPNYRQDELIHILRTEGISPSKAELLSAAFIKQHAYAIKNNLSPAPTFRTLLREAKKINSSQVEPEHKPLSLSPPDATNSPTPTENEINPQEKEAVLKLIALCNSYKQHLEKTIGYKKSIDISTTKIQKINSLLETLKSNTSNKEKLSKFQKDLFEESTIQSLSLRRADKTTVSRKFLQACAAILGLLGLLPLGIAMLISKIATRSENNTGRFRFWNTSGQGLINDAGSILTKHNRSEKKKH